MGKLSDILKVFCLSIFFTAIAKTEAFGLTSELPILNFDGFAWAENLAFDGLGNMFVSEAVRGELWKISLCKDGLSYCGGVYLSKGLSQFGGLAITPCGKKIYCGVTFEDGSKGIISASTVNATDTGSDFSVFLVTEHQPNGLAADWNLGKLYYTDEGLGDATGGTVRSVDIETKTEFIIKDHVGGADGAWFDSENRLLYVGWLEKKISLFNMTTDSPVFVNDYPGLSTAVSHLHILDDITLLTTTNKSDISETYILGADWTGRSIQMFTLSGVSAGEVPIPEDLKLYEPTSVRWGKGPGFDENSIYISEGGGATKHVTNRRIVQVKMR
jgi:hypothetical protein